MHMSSVAIELQCTAEDGGDREDGGRALSHLGA